jgi:hypothetical protein
MQKEYQPKMTDANYSCLRERRTTLVERRLVAKHTKALSSGDATLINSAAKQIGAWHRKNFLVNESSDE